MAKIAKFEDLPIWRESIAAAKKIYSITNIGLFSRDYGLRDQIRRATVSISSNIVEGFEKSNNNEFIRFLRISKGSTGETRNDLYLAKELGYISEEEFVAINGDLLEIAKHLGGLIAYLSKKKYSNEFDLKKSVNL